MVYNSFQQYSLWILANLWRHINLTMENYLQHFVNVKNCIYLIEAKQSWVYYLGLKIVM